MCVSGGDGGRRAEVVEMLKEGGGSPAHPMAARLGAFRMSHHVRCASTSFGRFVRESGGVGASWLGSR